MIALIAIISLIASTAAWIAYDRAPAQSELAITSDSTDVMIMNYNVYRCLWDEENHEYDYYDVTGQPFQLNSYDVVFGRNTYTPAFLRVHLQGDAISSGHSIRFTMLRANTDPEPEGGPTTENGLWDSQGLAANYLSNIMQMEGAQIQSLEDETDPAVIYTTANAYDGWSESGSFVTTELDSESKTQFASKSGQSGGVTVTFAEGTDGEAEIFLRLEYSTEYVMAYLNNHTDGNQAHRIDKTLSYEFVGDVTQILVEMV